MWSDTGTGRLRPEMSETRLRLRPRAKSHRCVGIDGIIMRMPCIAGHPPFLPPSHNTKVELLEGQVKELRARCADILKKAEASEAALRRQIEEQQLKLTQAIKENGRVMEMR